MGNWPGQYEKAGAAYSCFLGRVDRPDHHPGTARARLGGQAVPANVGRELEALSPIAAPVLGDDETARHLMVQLKVLNEILWDLEIGVRAKEAANRFDAEFVESARAIYKRNGERAALKRQLNLRLESELVEEKNYQPSN